MEGNSVQVRVPSASSTPPRGLSGTISLSGAVLPRLYDGTGKLLYDTAVRVGHSTSRIIYTRDTDSRARPISENDEFPRPSQGEIEVTTASTRKALEAIINQRIQSTLPTQQGLATTLTAASTKKTVAYKPSEANLFINPDAPKSRLITIVEAPQDPLNPAKFKHRKLPRGPPSPPVPVLHSPIRKATADEYKAWIVPPSISSWKNPKGYTIPLDKRLACDGRSLQEAVINDKFASFAESLYVAEAHAREEVARRNAIERSIAANERMEKEARLRAIAQETRLSASRETSKVLDDEAFRERETIRRDAAQQRKRANRERDVSEKVALNVPISTGTSSSLFDTRLFNQSEGITSGFAPSDDTYSVYEKPLFTASASSAIYKPTIAIDEEGSLTSKRHTGLGASEVSGEQRSGPVRFERGEVICEQKEAASKDEAEDPFGLDTFLQAAKRGRHAS